MGRVSVERTDQCGEDVGDLEESGEGRSGVKVGLGKDSVRINQLYLIVNLSMGNCTTLCGACGPEGTDFDKKVLSQAQVEHELNANQVIKESIQKEQASHHSTGTHSRKGSESEEVAEKTTLPPTTLPNGAIYTGEWDKNGHRCGRGI